MPRACIATVQCKTSCCLLAGFAPTVAANWSDRCICLRFVQDLGYDYIDRIYRLTVVLRLTGFQCSAWLDRYVVDGWLTLLA